MFLASTSESLEFATSSASSTDYVVSYIDHTTSGGTAGANHGNVASATTTTLAAAPGASTQRQVKEFWIRNAGTTAQTITVKKDISSTERTMFVATLQGGEQLCYSETAGFYVTDAVGRIKQVTPEVSGTAGKPFALRKVGTASEAAAEWYCYAKDTGFPGAWAVGTPGLAGRATDGTAAADAGCVPITNPSSGYNYLTGGVLVSSVAHHFEFWDVLWVNSGIVVTTTTAQTINSVAFPARDNNGSSNGAGLIAGILVTTATTNAGAITNTTMSYTDQDGNAGATATMASFNASAVIGHVELFQLAAGDSGIRSIQTVTLGTSYAGGAVSLFVARPICSVPAVTANLPWQVAGVDPKTGVRLYNGTCLLPFARTSATTATTWEGTLQVTER